MRFITFDPFRTLHIPDVTYVKPELFYDRLELVTQADCLLFPPYWLINTIVYGLGKPVFPSVSTYHLGHDKVEMTRALQAVSPEHIPATFILPNDAVSSGRILDELPFPFVAKTVRSSGGQGVYLIRNPRDWADYRQRHAILYAQQYLAIDRDMRLVVVGDRVIAGYWRRSSGGFRTNVAQGAGIDYAPLPADAVNLVTDLARRLHIDHAGFDVAMVEGRPFLFEFNRLFGNQGLVQQGIRIESHIGAWINRRFPLGPLLDSVD